jgi:hypothetical protein
MLRLQGAAVDQIWLLWWECAFAVCILLLGCTIAAVVAVLGHCLWDSTVGVGPLLAGACVTGGLHVGGAPPLTGP